MQAAISQSIMAIIGMQAGAFINETERDAPLHPLKMSVITMDLVASVLCYFVNMFILLFRYKAYLVIAILLLGYVVLEKIIDRCIQKQREKTGKVIYIDATAKQLLEQDSNNLFGPMIVKNYDEMEKKDKDAK